MEFDKSEETELVKVIRQAVEHQGKHLKIAQDALVGDGIVPHDATVSAGMVAGIDVVLNLMRIHIAGAEDIIEAVGLDEAVKLAPKEEETP